MHWTVLDCHDHHFVAKGIELCERLSVLYEAEGKVVKGLDFNLK